MKQLPINTTCLPDRLFLSLFRAGGVKLVEAYLRVREAVMNAARGGAR